MATLLIRLAAPLQSWGVESKFDARRDTAKEPSKSGVLGMIAAALGIRRDEKDRLRELTGLRFGVLVEREGRILRDFHTAKHPKLDNPAVTNRYYLMDAAFVVGLECEDEELLHTLADALTHPVFPLYLGRRSCPPMGKMVLDIVPEPLREALMQKAQNGQRLLMDALPNEDGGIVKDVPESFDPSHRLYGYRRVKEIMAVKQDIHEHDAFAELEE